MPYCPRCGNNISETDRFCRGCGSSLSDNTGMFDSRQELFQGVVHKCPSCGADVGSFVAVCPECGHEINSKKVSASLVEFNNNVQMYDNLIANSSFPIFHISFSSRNSNSKRSNPAAIFLFILILPLISVMLYSFVTVYLFYIITVIIMLVILFLKIKSKTMNRFEKEKVTYINNFSFPNERESLIEAQLYIKKQLTAIECDSIKGTTGRWNKIWKNKAKEIHKQTKLLLNNDEIETRIYEEIKNTSKTIRNKYSFKRILIMLFELLIIAVLLYISAKWKSSHSELEFFLFRDYGK